MSGEEIRLRRRGERGKGKGDGKGEIRGEERGRKECGTREQGRVGCSAVVYLGGGACSRGSAGGWS